MSIFRSSDYQGRHAAGSHRAEYGSEAYLATREGRLAVRGLIIVTAQRASSEAQDSIGVRDEQIERVFKARADLEAFDAGELATAAMLRYFGHDTPDAE